MLNYDNIPADMRASISAFYDRADEVTKELALELETETVPETIYHYTDGAGLRGILESGKLRLTDIFYLNDPAELRHGVNYAIDALRAAADRGPDEVKLFYREFRKVGSAGGIEASAHFFVTSFSRAGDDLGQWRAYADDGRGYALGFDGKALENAFVKKGDEPISGHATFPITYNDDRLREMQRRIVAEVVPLISETHGRKLSNDIIAAYMAELSVNFSVPILRTSLFFKHKAYANEAEYRFVQIQRGDRPAEKVLYRDRPYSLVRYTEFDWRSIAPGALKEIVIGPAADTAKAGRYSRDCLFAFHLGGSVSLRKSDIPCRAR